MIEISFKNWRQFGPNLDRGVIVTWLGQVRRKSRTVFRRGLLRGPHTGRIYRRRGGSHRASVNRPLAEFPASDSGGLIRSIKDRQEQDRATIGTNQHYSIFLRYGTSKMQRRRMSQQALVEGAKDAKPSSRGWVKYHRGAQRVRNLNS